MSDRIETLHAPHGTNRISGTRPANPDESRFACDRLVDACEMVARQWRGGHPPGHDAIVELHRALKKSVPELLRPELDRELKLLTMRLALECIKTALNDSSDGYGDYHDVRAFLNSRGFYNDDLNDLRVLHAVCKAALEEK